MELFAHGKESHEGTPLAERLRPQSLSDVLGQKEILSLTSPLRKMIEADRIPSLLLWGPPGCGKTSMAMALAKQTKHQFISVNAVDTGAKDLKEIGESAKLRRFQFNEGTVLFVDEIHRLNKAQQDVLLPFVEKGDFVLIGATTENPSFRINSALLSRCRTVVFKSLSEEALNSLLERAFRERTVDNSLLSEEAKSFLISQAGGDGRRLINLAEQVLDFVRLENRTNPILKDELPEIFGASLQYYDRKGDAHYDTISAFIKSIRGSDPDAALYYLARMLEGGEDPLFIARRLTILASEDVGNADPRALPLAISGMQAVELIGIPEAAINLAQVVTYLASAPKSNRSYIGLKKAQEEVRKSGTLPIPLSVRNAPTKLMKSLGYGEDYNYAHEGERGWMPQQFLPDQIKDKKFYEPSDRGFEKTLKTYLDWLKGKKPNDSPK
jgi:putative ATPase